MAKGGPLERISGRATAWTGSSWAVGLAVLTILVWAATGPIFQFSDTWQLVINTGTTIVTFLMVFLIQRQQNKDSLAIHLKLNELVAAIDGASNRLVNVEDLSEDEVRLLHQHFCKLVELAKKDESLTESHSIEDAEQDHARKQAVRRGQSPANKPPEPAATEPEEPAETDGFQVNYAIGGRRAKRPPDVLPGPASTEKPARTG